MPKPAQRSAFAAFLTAPDAGGELEGARLLPVDLIDPNPYQPRQTFDPQKLEELVASIRVHGVLEPILVRPIGDRYQIIAGERRVRAARLAELAQIPALVMHDLTEEQAAFVTAVENLQRADLDLEDEARQYQYLLELTGLSQRDLAKRLGIDHEYLSRRVRLLKRPDLLAQVRAGALTLRAALAQLAVAHQQAGGLSLRETQSAGAARTNGENGSFVAEEPSVSHLSHGETTSPVLLERGELDAQTRERGKPTLFRWRPLQQAMTWLEQTPPSSVPPDERAPMLAQIEAIETQLAAWRQALAGDA